MEEMRIEMGTTLLQE